MSSAEIKAWAVHVYTALGAALGLLALEAIGRGDYRAAFAWMAVATFIDSTDGTLARRARVKTVLPRFDGARLDDIVDYLNYAIVPLFLAHHAPGLLPAGSAGLLVVIAPAMASAYGFCQADAKTDDHFFKGFPSYWNIVVLYLYTLALPVALNVAILLFLALMVFVPLRYLYPSRSPVARKRMYVLGTIWAVMVIVLIVQLPRPSRMLAVVSLFYPAYYIWLSCRLYLRARGWRLRRAARDRP